MTIPDTWEPLTEQEPVLHIAQDLFETMIDGEPGHLYPWFDDTPDIKDARYAWVDVEGPIVTRVMVSAGHATGAQLARSMLMMGDDEAVSEADFTDAVGEIANVVGGNIKSLVTNPGSLTLPVVTHVAPDHSKATALIDTYFGWKGAPVGVSLWAISGKQGSDATHPIKDEERWQP